MIVIRMILLLNLCASSYAPGPKNGETTTDDGNDFGAVSNYTTSFQGQQKKEENINYALILIRDGEDLYIPNIVEKENDKPIFKHDFNQNVTYWCPTEDSNTIALIDKYPETSDFNKEACLFETTSETNEPKICNKELIPYLALLHLPILQSQSECGPYNESGELYGFKYQVCRPDTTKSIRQRLGFTVKVNPIKAEHIKKSMDKEGLEIFDFCYNASMNTVLFTRHKIKSPSLLKNHKHMDNLASYKSDEISTDDYSVFNDAFVNKKNEIESNNLTPHFSVPPEDMAFGIWKKPLYHYSNVLEMPKKVSSLWDFINARIRNLAMETNSTLEIFMGEFSGEQKFWCKMVLDKKSSSSVAIIVRSPDLAQPENNSAKNNKPTLKILKHCVQRCNFEKWEGYQNFSTEFATCCKVNRKIVDLFGIRYFGFSKFTFNAKYLNLDLDGFNLAPSS